MVLVAPYRLRISVKRARPGFAADGVVVDHRIQADTGIHADVAGSGLGIHHGQPVVPGRVHFAQRAGFHAQVTNQRQVLDPADVTGVGH
jgi:hypothetical protein